MSTDYVAASVRNHSWGEPERYQFKTELICDRCRLVQVRHYQFEGARPVRWTEYWRDGVKIAVNKRPTCGPVEVLA